MSVGITSVALARPCRPATKTAWRSLVLLQCATFGTPGCLYDANDRCGPNQQIGEDIRCVCAEGSAWTIGGCVVCGANEQASANGCACIAGHLRPTADAACEAAPSGLGLACDNMSAPCTDSVY